MKAAIYNYKCWIKETDPQVLENCGVKSNFDSDETLISLKYCEVLLHPSTVLAAYR